MVVFVVPAFEWDTWCFLLAIVRPGRGSTELCRELGVYCALALRAVTAVWAWSLTGFGLGQRGVLQDHLPPAPSGPYLEAEASRRRS